MLLMVACGNTNGSVEEVKSVIADEAIEECQLLELLISEGYSPEKQEEESCSELSRGTGKTEQSDQKHSS